MISLLDLETSAQLTFSALWQASQPDLSAISTLLLRAGHESGSQSLLFAAVEDPRCRVLSRAEDGGYKPVCDSATSGYPPYQALFNLALTGAELGQAQAALRGEFGHVLIEYSARCLVPSQDEASLQADNAALRDWLGGAGPDGFRKLQLCPTRDPHQRQPAG